MSILRQIGKDYTCQECGEECKDGENYYDDYGVVCHVECATDKINNHMTGHYYADLGDR